MGEADHHGRSWPWWEKLLVALSILCLGLSIPTLPVMLSFQLHIQKPEHIWVF